MWSFDENENEVFAFANSNVELSANFQKLPENLNSLTIEWTHDGKTLRNSDKHKLTKSENAVQLAIYDVKREDSGTYKLFAKTETGEQSHKAFKLFVNDKSHGNNPPEFIRRLQDCSVKVGTHTRLLVEIRSSSDVTVNWFRNERRVAEDDRIALVHEGTFYCVEISSVSIDDGGTWTCLAENSEGRNSTIANFNVLVPKAYKVPEFVEELRAILTEQGTVSLECKVIGIPTPKLRWFKDSKEIKAGDIFSLTANPNDPTSLGTYTCEASNCMGKTYSTSKLHMAGSHEGLNKSTEKLFEAAPIFSTELKNVKTKIGDPISISCNLLVPPWPKSIAWFNQAGKIEANDKYILFEDGLGCYILEVKYSEISDEGTWKFIATSSDGSSSISTCNVSMDVPRNYRKPRFMQNLKAILTEEGLVSFECKVVGYPTPNLRWFKDDHELKPGDVYQLTGTNSLGSYSCIAKNCMGEATSSAILTLEDIQNQLTEEERIEMLQKNQPPKFTQGLFSMDGKINEEFKFSVRVKDVTNNTQFSWLRDGVEIAELNDLRYQSTTKNDTCILLISNLELVDQAEWQVIASNEFGRSTSTCYLKLQIPKHYKKPTFLECLRAVLTEEGAVNLECKVIGVPQPQLRWFKDNEELKPGDIHKIISGEAGACSLGTYTCEAHNCMGTVSSSATLLGFDQQHEAAKKLETEKALLRQLSLSTIHEERTSQMYDTPAAEISMKSCEDKGDISFSFDGKEVSVSLYETPDLTEEEALQIIEMYAEEISEHVTEQNFAELPPLRFQKETTHSGNMLMEAVVIDVSPEYFTIPEEDLRTEADIDVFTETEDLETTTSSSKKKRLEQMSKSGVEEFFSLSQSKQVMNMAPADLMQKEAAANEEETSETDVQTFESARSSMKAVSSKYFTDDSLKIDRKHVSDVENKTVANKDESSMSIQQDISGERGDGLKAAVRQKKKKSIPQNQFETLKEKCEVVEKHLKVIDNEVDMQSKMMMTPSSAESSIEIVKSILKPVEAIQECLQASDKEEIVLVNLLMHVKELSNALSIIEKCVEMDSTGRTLVQRTSVCVIESTGEQLYDFFNELKEQYQQKVKSPIGTEAVLLINDMQSGICITEDTIKSQALIQEASNFEASQRVLDAIGDVPQAQFQKSIASVSNYELPKEASILKVIYELNHMIEKQIEKLSSDQSQKITENPLEDLLKEVKKIETKIDSNLFENEFEQKIMYKVRDAVSPPTYELYKSFEILIKEKKYDNLNKLLLPFQEIQHGLISLMQEVSVNDDGQQKELSTKDEDNRKMVSGFIQNLLYLESNIGNVFRNQNENHYSFIKLLNSLNRFVSAFVHPMITSAGMEFVEQTRLPIEELNYCFRHIEEKTNSNCIGEILEPLHLLDQSVFVVQNLKSNVNNVILMDEFENIKSCISECRRNVLASLNENEESMNSEGIVPLSFLDKIHFLEGVERDISNLTDMIQFEGCQNNEIQAVLDQLNLFSSRIKQVKSDMNEQNHEAVDFNEIKEFASLLKSIQVEMIAHFNSQNTVDQEKNITFMQSMKNKIKENLNNLAEHVKSVEHSVMESLMETIVPSNIDDQESLKFDQDVTIASEIEHFEVEESLASAIKEIIKDQTEKVSEIPQSEKPQEAKVVETEKKLSVISTQESLAFFDESKVEDITEKSIKSSHVAAKQLADEKQAVQNVQTQAFEAHKSLDVSLASDTVAIEKTETEKLTAKVNKNLVLESKVGKSSDVSFAIDDQIVSELKGNEENLQEKISKVTVSSELMATNIAQSNLLENYTSIASDHPDSGTLIEKVQEGEFGIGKLLSSFKIEQHVDDDRTEDITEVSFSCDDSQFDEMLIVELLDKKLKHHTEDELKSLDVSCSNSLRIENKDGVEKLISSEQNEDKLVAKVEEKPDVKIADEAQKVVEKTKISETEEIKESNVTIKSEIIEEVKSSDEIVQKLNEEKLSSKPLEQKKEEISKVDEKKSKIKSQQSEENLRKKSEEEKPKMAEEKKIQDEKKTELKKQESVEISKQAKQEQQELEVVKVDTENTEKTQKSDQKTVELKKGQDIKESKQSSEEKTKLKSQKSEEKSKTTKSAQDEPLKIVEETPVKKVEEKPDLKTKKSDEKLSSQTKTEETLKIDEGGLKSKKEENEATKPDLTTQKSQEKALKIVEESETIDKKPSLGSQKSEEISSRKLVEDEALKIVEEPEISKKEVKKAESLQQTKLEELVQPESLKIIEEPSVSKKDQSKLKEIQKNQSVDESVQNEPLKIVEETQSSTKTSATKDNENKSGLKTQKSEEKKLVQEETLKIVEEPNIFEIKEEKILSSKTQKSVEESKVEDVSLKIVEESSISKTEKSKLEKPKTKETTEQVTSSEPLKIVEEPKILEIKEDKVSDLKTQKNVEESKLDVSLKTLEESSISKTEKSKLEKPKTNETTEQVTSSEPLKIVEEPKILEIKEDKVSDLKTQKSVEESKLDVSLKILEESSISKTEESKLEVSKTKESKAKTSNEPLKIVEETLISKKDDNKSVEEDTKLNSQKNKNNSQTKTSSDDSLKIVKESIVPENNDSKNEEPLKIDENKNKVDDGKLKAKSKKSVDEPKTNMKPEELPAADKSDEEKSKVKTSKSVENTDDSKSQNEKLKSLEVKEKDSIKEETKKKGKESAEIAVDQSSHREVEDKNLSDKTIGKEDQVDGKNSTKDGTATVKKQKSDHQTQEKNCSEKPIETDLKNDINIKTSLDTKSSEKSQKEIEKNNEKAELKAELKEVYEEKLINTDVKEKTNTEKVEFIKVEDSQVAEKIPTAQEIVEDQKIKTKEESQETKKSEKTKKSDQKDEAASKPKLNEKTSEKSISKQDEKKVEETMKEIKPQEQHVKDGKPSEVLKPEESKKDSKISDEDNKTKTTLEEKKSDVKFKEPEKTSSNKDDKAAPVKPEIEEKKTDPKETSDSKDVKAETTKDSEKSKEKALEKDVSNVEEKASKKSVKKSTEERKSEEVKKDEPLSPKRSSKKSKKDEAEVKSSLEKVSEKLEKVETVQSNKVKKVDSELEIQTAPAKSEVKPIEEPTSPKRTSKKSKKEEVELQSSSKIEQKDFEQNKENEKTKIESQKAQKSTESFISKEEVRSKVEEETIKEQKITTQDKKIEEKASVDEVDSPRVRSKVETTTDQEKSTKSSKTDRKQTKRIPSFMARLKSRSVSENTSTKLTCAVSDLEYTVRWEKDGKTIRQGDKYSIENANGMLSLEIKSVTSNDAGNYSCFISNGQDEVETSAMLTVFEDTSQLATAFTRNLKDLLKSDLESVPSKMVRERKGKKGKSKEPEEVQPELLQVPEEPRINRFLKREKSPFEVGDAKELQVASSHAIIDKACVMDISGGAAGVAGKVDEYINLLFTDYCSLDKASCADISEVKIVIVEEEETAPVPIVPEVSAEEQEEQRRKEEEERLKKEAEEARKRAEREEAERKAKEEAERLAAEEAERLAKEEEERKIREEEEKRIKEEEEKARKKAEAEAKKKAEEEEKAKKAAEEAEKKKQEEEAARLAAEQAAYDSDKELIPVKEDPGIEWAPVEDNDTEFPSVLQEILEQRAAAAAESESESEPEMTERDRDLEWQRQRQMMRPPLVISHLKSRAVPELSTAKLTCNVTGPAITVRWLKNGNPIELKPEKYKFFNSEGLLSLEILNVKKRDAAEYTCKVTNKNGETETMATLTVYSKTDSERPSPPTFISIKDKKPTEEVKVEEEKVELDKWGDPIKKSRRVIRPLSLWAQREKLEFTVHLHDMTVCEGRNARLICGVQGGKDLEFKWFKNGKKMRFTEKEPRILDYSYDPRTACIGIELTNEKDAGEYKCVFTDKKTQQTLETSCRLIVVPRIKKTKELAAKIPPAFVRKLAYTHKPDDDQLIIHCTIMANPEPKIKWTALKIPLWLCSLPRVKMMTHPDDVHEHIIASLVIDKPSFLDNGNYTIEVENEMGKEVRTVTVNFQTEEEYNALYFQKYMEHKELTKYHVYRPGEVRWEDVVPEVHEFHFWEPPEEAEKTAKLASGKKYKRVKPRKVVKKKVMTPWGDEKEEEVETTDDDADSIEVTDNEEEKEEEEEAVEDDNDWLRGGAPEEDEVVEETVPETTDEVTEEQPAEEETAPESAVETEVIPEPEPEPEPEKVEEQVAEVVEEAPVEETVIEAKPKEFEEEVEEFKHKIHDLKLYVEEIVKRDHPPKPPSPEIENIFDSASTSVYRQSLASIRGDEEFETESTVSSMYGRKKDDVEHPIILRRPKFYITDFQLRKKFYFVNKLIDIELLKGKTLRLQSISSSCGPVTCEWRHNGRLIHAPTARKTIEFYPRKNQAILEIENTRVLDSGTYTCIHYNNYTEPLIDSCKVTITVPKPMETADQPPTFTKLLTDKYVEKSDELILHCQVRGNPKPEIKWFKNDIEILPDYHKRYRVAHTDDGECTLTISNIIKLADRGRYEVKAKNCAGEEACWLRVWFRGREDNFQTAEEVRKTENMYKSRHIKPKDEDEWPVTELYHSTKFDEKKEYDHRYKLTWLTKPMAQTIPQGTTLKLVAFVAGKFPQFEWYFNDIPLVHGRKYRQSVTNNGKGCLVINNVQPSDSGTYRLVVKNYANSIDTDAKVTVYAFEHKNFEPPIFTNILSDTYNTQSNQLIIESVIKPDSDYKFKWYRDDVEIRTSSAASSSNATSYEQEFDKSTGTLKLIITYPTSSDCGLYRCCILDKNLKKVDETSHLVYKIFNPQPHVTIDRENATVATQNEKTVFEKSLIDATFEEGSSFAEIKCRISSYYSNSSVTWLKDGKEISEGNKYQILKSYNRLSLNILNLDKNDSGVYECSVTNQGFVESTKCNLNVSDRKESTRKAPTVNEKEDLISPTNKALLDTFNKSSHTRSFHSPSIYDSTHSLNKPSFTTEISERTVTENTSSVKFTCSLLSDDCEIFWEKNGFPLPSSSKFVQTFSDGLSILEIFNVTNDDAGKYSCVAMNKFGRSITSGKLKVYGGFTPSIQTPPTFSRQMAESYNLHHDMLTLECRVRGTPKPNIQWMKDGDYIMPGDKYEQIELPDGTCKLTISRPEPEEDSGTYTCEAECNGCSDSISHNVHYEGSVEKQFNRVHRYYHRDPLKPYFKTGLTDYTIPSGGTIALFVESNPNGEAEWFRDRYVIDHKPPKRFLFNDGNGFFACVINAATMDESAKYVCKVTNSYGTSQSSSYIDIINPNSVGKGQKPPSFLTRPQTEIKIRAGDPFSMSFRVGGEPKPRIQWFKAAKEITNSGRTIKEVFNDYVRFSIKEAKESDTGIYFIVARNKHGVDRAFCRVTVRERQELTTYDQQYTTSPDYSDVSYLKNPPGQIPCEPLVTDSSDNHLSLSWMKPDETDSAPVIGYRIDVWLVGKESDATWKELGTSPITSFDVFNLKRGCEYHFRVIPKNRYGYGPSTQTTYPVMFGDVIKMPEFSKILPGHLKVLIHESVTLECVVSGSPRPSIKWLKDGLHLDNSEVYQQTTMGPLCRLTIQDVNASCNGRYTCEATNKEGRVSTFVRLQTVNDPKLLEADNNLRTTVESSTNNSAEMIPLFITRLRDRRVQCTYPVRLTCQSIGVPKPTIKWFKDGRQLVEDDRIVFLDENTYNTLEISRTFLEDSGEYTATIQNNFGSVSCHCSLIVDKGIRAYIAPEFIRSLEEKVICNEHDEVKLTAQVEAYPSVGVTWHKNGLKLRPSRRVVATLSDDGVVTLVITNATHEDSALYTCVASNVVGRVESNCRINVIRDPSSQEPLKSSETQLNAFTKQPFFVEKPRSSEAYEGDTVIIGCEVIGDPKPDVIWLRDFLKPEYYKDATHFKSVVGSENKYWLEIPNAKLSYTGTYSVIATNCHGQSKAIISLQIFAKDNKMEGNAASTVHSNIESIPRVSNNLKDLRCCDGDAISLECFVEGSPEPNVFWEKDGKIIHDKCQDYKQEFDGKMAKLSIKRIFPEDEGVYTIVVCNRMGRVKSSCCILVDVPEEKENLLSRQLSRPVAFMSTTSTPMSTPRSTPARSLSPLSALISKNKTNLYAYRQHQYRFSAPKFYSVPHNRVCEEGESVRFHCVISGQPIPWTTWDKDGIIVNPTSRIVVGEKDDQRFLEVEEVSFDDAGLYRITLENDYGRIEATARLDVIISSKQSFKNKKRASSVPAQDHRARSVSRRRIMGYSTKIGGRIARATQIRAQSTPNQKKFYVVD